MANFSDDQFPTPEPGPRSGDHIIRDHQGLQRAPEAVSQDQAMPDVGATTPTFLEFESDSRRSNRPYREQYSEQYDNQYGQQYNDQYNEQYHQQYDQQYGQPDPYQDAAPSYEDGRESVLRFPLERYIPCHGYYYSDRARDFFALSATSQSRTCGPYLATRNSSCRSCGEPCFFCNTNSHRGEHCLIIRATCYQAPASQPVAHQAPAPPPNPYLAPPPRRPNPYQAPLPRRPGPHQAPAPRPPGPNQAPPPRQRDSYPAAPSPFQATASHQAYGAGHATSPSLSGSQAPPHRHQDMDNHPQHREQQGNIGDPSRRRGGPDAFADHRRQKQQDKTDASSRSRGDPEQQGNISAPSRRFGGPDAFADHRRQKQQDKADAGQSEIAATRSFAFRGAASRGRGGHPSGRRNQQAGTGQSGQQPASQGNSAQNPLDIPNTPLTVPRPTNLMDHVLGRDSGQSVQPEEAPQGPKLGLGKSKYSSE